MSITNTKYAHTSWAWTMFAVFAVVTMLAGAVSFGTTASAQEETTVPPTDEPLVTLLMPQGGENEDCDKREGDEYRSIDENCDEEESDSITIVATKIVCTDETELPNWGTGAPDITSSTATDWVADHDSCTLTPDWNFEWVLNSDLDDPGDTYVGEAGIPWNVFGPTNANGAVSVVLSEDNLDDESMIWVREVLQTGYLPFTYDTTDEPDNSNDVSAELYCHTDGLNYDNLEWIDHIKEGKTYYCVAWNVPEKGSITIEKDVVGNAEQWSFGFTGSQGEFALTNSVPSKTFEVTPGTYTFNETDQEGWALSNVSCEEKELGKVGDNDLSVSVAPGEDVTCTFTNTQDDVEAPLCPADSELVFQESFETPVLEGTGVWTKIASLADWVISKVVDATPTTLEFHRGWSGNVAADAEQYVELDGDHSTRITRTVATTPGAEYKLYWAFAPRHAIADAQNKLSVEVEGLQVATNGPATGNAPLAVGDWTLSNYTFTAGDASTDVAFSDVGNPNDSLGTFLDDVRLCKTKKTEEPKQCLIYSDTTTLIGEVPAVLTWVHDSWTEELTTGKWIWNAYETTKPAEGETLTFTKTFNVDTTPSGATLKVSGDNSYVAYLNGNPLTCDGTGSTNYFAVDTCSAPVTAGVNTLTFVVTNDAYETNNPQTNPGGLVYELNIAGSSCSPVPEEVVDVCPNLAEVQTTVPDDYTKNNDGQCVTTTNGGGGSSRHHHNSTPKPKGSVEGASDSRDDASQVTAIPTVAGVNTGAGGASQTPAQAIPMMALLAMVASLAVIRKTSNVF